jgi:uncharacterized DUF497 family protein
MNDDAFEWDEAKAAGNDRNHGIAFDLAKSVLADPFCDRSRSLLRSIASTTAKITAKDRFIT